MQNKIAGAPAGRISKPESGTMISVKDEAGKVITEIKTEVTLESNYTEL